MKTKSVVQAAVLALSAMFVQAANAAFVETSADGGLTSKMLSRWAAAEGITVTWEAQYDIRTAYSTGKSQEPLEVEAQSAMEALERFMAGYRREHRKREAEVFLDAYMAPQLFACYYAQSKTFVVREQGQRECAEN